MKLTLELPGDIATIRQRDRWLRRTLLAMLLAFGLCISYGVILAQSQGPLAAQKPPTEERAVAVYTHYEAMPPTAVRAYENAAAVVHVEISNSRPGERRLGGVRVATADHVATVKEVLKGEGITQGMALEVSQEVSSDLDGVKHRGAMNVLLVGREYVLFLDKPLGRTSYAVAWGDSGVFQLSDHSVAIGPGAMRMWQLRDQVARSEFLGTLRSLKRKDSRNK